MTFHLEGPWLTKSGKSKQKQKFKSAAEKQNSLKLEKEWEQLQAKYATKTKIKPSVKIQVNLDPKIPESRNTTKDIKSLNTIGGVGSSKESQHYTGEKLIGISIIHKSCLQPIFNEQEAKDAANMRR
jgi:hypothetical protein